MQPRPPELLAPAGSPGMLATALQYGADAVYMGGPGPNLRAKGSRFSWQEMEDALRLLRSRGRKGYVCLNAFPREHELGLVRESLERLASLPVDALPHGLIIADPGVLHLAHELAPQLPVHLSTQANTANAASLAFWKEQGVCRVNLARELDISAMKSLFAAPAKQGLELEVFVHGAQCMALSGRCLLSAWLNNRPANLGQCTHPCRYDYQVHLEERLRPGAALWELGEEDGYSQVLAAEDLCLLPYLRWLRRADALKLEGRTKSEGHLAQVLDVYRTALDQLALRGRFDPGPFLDELRHTAKRPLTSGMFLPAGRRRTWLHPDAASMRPLLGKVVEQRAPGCVRVAVRAPWDALSAVVVLEPGLRRFVLHAKEYSLENEAGERLTRTHPGLEVWLRCSRELEPGLFLRRA